MLSIALVGGRSWWRGWSLRLLRGSDPMPTPQFPHLNKETSNVLCRFAVLCYLHISHSGTSPRRSALSVHNSWRGAKRVGDLGSVTSQVLSPHTLVPWQNAELEGKLAVMRTVRPAPASLWHSRSSGIAMPNLPLQPHLPLCMCCSTKCPECPCFPPHSWIGAQL